MKHRGKNKMGRPRKDFPDELALIADEILIDPSLSVAKAAQIAGISFAKIAHTQNTKTDSVRRQFYRSFNRNKETLMSAAQKRRQERNMLHDSSTNQYNDKTIFDQFHHLQEIMNAHSDKLAESFRIMQLPTENLRKQLEAVISPVQKLQEMHLFPYSDLLAQHQAVRDALRICGRRF